MPEDIHPPGTDCIQIPVAFEIFDPDALARFDGDQRHRFVILHLAARMPEYSQIALYNSLIIHDALQ
jgi:hypothetical protein